MEIQKVFPHELGENVLKNIHNDVFGVPVASSHFKFDYALTSTIDNELVTYTLVQEIDADTCEFTYGGTVEKFRGQKTVDSFLAFLNAVEGSYVVIQVHNENTKMLSLGIYMGFKIIGTRVSNDDKLYIIMKKKVKGE